MAYQSGRHFLQIPGPTNVPDRILRAMDLPTIDHRSAEAAALTLSCLEGMKAIFRTKGAVVIFPASGTGAWEAALVNTLSPGDGVLAFDNGHFASLWARMAGNLNLKVELMAGDWRLGPDAAALRSRLEKDTRHELKAVMVVHNETSTGVKSDIPAIRQAIDSARHPALLLVDTISSLATMDYRHDEWGVDVTVSGSQKGLMLPPGLSFNAIGEKAMAAGSRSTLTKSYWRWDDMIENNRKGFFPYTPATNLLYGLREALKMLIEEEGLANVFTRHDRHAEATRRAVRGWGLEIFAQNPAEFSSSLTAVLLPAGFNEAELRAVVLKNFNMSLGAGLSKIAGKVFRMGHLGSFNDLMLAGTLCGVEMGLELAGVPHKKGGVTEALTYLTAAASRSGLGSMPLHVRAANEAHQ
jgi:alanine-glyoxylate transaminase / serine-glyoxylate transaminase / serine-pyruvate transaminase